MGCNESTSNCKYKQDDTLCCFYRGEAGNPVLIILQEPGGVEKELGRPVTGRTGANLCRLFLRMKEIGCNKDTEPFCIWRVTIMNAQTENGCAITEDSSYKDKLGILSDKSIALCFGEKAVGFLKESAQEYLHNLKISFCFPHIGTRGLSSFQMGRENWKQSKESREARLLQEMANFIEKMMECNTPHCYAVQDFASFIEDNGFVWRPDCISGKWTLREYLNSVNAWMKRKESQNGTLQMPPV